MDESERFTDRETDAVILNTAPPLLQNQVLRYGRLLYEQNQAILMTRLGDFDAFAKAIHAYLAGG